jgi:hypothetical protein
MPSARRRQTARARERDVIRDTPETHAGAQAAMP